jgi:hypothetical protein
MNQVSPVPTLAPLPRTGRQRRAPRSPTFGCRRPKIAARIVLRGIRTAVMHAQILERARTLTPRYVANASHSWASADGSLRIGGTGRPAGMLRGQLFGPGGNTTPEYWIDGRRVRAAAKAPQRKRPCRSRATARRSLIRHACVKHQRASRICAVRSQIVL